MDEETGSEEDDDELEDDDEDELETWDDGLEIVFSQDARAARVSKEQRIRIGFFLVLPPFETYGEMLSNFELLNTFILFYF